MQLANDLGYGEVKISIDGEDLVFPSAVAYMQSQDVHEPVAFETKETEQQYIADLFNHMETTVSSPAITTSSRVMIGTAAVNSRLPLRQFDVNDFSGKSQSDLSMLLTLSTIAAKAVKEAYAAGKPVFGETLKVETPMVTALPIAEGQKPGVTDAYRQRYMKGTHTVTFSGLVNPITVTIKFTAVFVMLEGETAQYAIKTAESDLKDAIWSDFKQHYPDLAKAMTADDLLAVQDVLGVDMGAGTTDLVAILKGRAAGFASQSIQYGFNNVLSDAVFELQNRSINFESAAELEEYLNKQPSPLEKAKYNEVLEIVKAQIPAFTNRLIDGISFTLRKAGHIAIVYVYGGGSIPMAMWSDFRNELDKKLRAYANGNVTPIVWIPASYAQGMNLRGLKKVAEKVGEGE